MTFGKPRMCDRAPIICDVKFIYQSSIGTTRITNAPRKI